MSITDLYNTIIHGDARNEISKLPMKSIDTIITSPPYYGQRDYKSTKQIGSEKSPDEYIDNLVEVFSGCKNLLKDTGSLWLNLGDKYLNGALLGMPWRVAIALQNDGWILRNDIIWHKPNAMPTSVKNRLTTDHEYIFFFTKKPSDYYFDQDAIREEHVTFSEHSKMRGGRNHFGKAGGTPENGKNKGNSNLHTGRWDQAFNPKGRNKRTVWSIPLSKFRGEHFAVFPEKLVEPCLLSGCPENGLVLDPFFGSGTTGLVALLNNRNYLGIEVNKTYITIANERINSYASLLNSNKKVL